MMMRKALLDGSVHNQALVNWIKERFTGTPLRVWSSSGGNIDSVYGSDWIKFSNTIWISTMLLHLKLFYLAYVYCIFARPWRFRWKPIELLALHSRRSYENHAKSKFTLQNKISEGAVVCVLKITRACLFFLEKYRYGFSMASSDQNLNIWFCNNSQPQHTLWK